MSKNNEIGTQGETLAVAYLVSKGYEILETNWRFSRAEIDIIARYEDHLVFIEVKARSYTYFGEPSDFVTSRKEDLIMDAANVYMDKIGYGSKFRFDIIGIVFNQDGSHTLEHVEDAFWNGW